MGPYLHQLQASMLSEKLFLLLWTNSLSGITTTTATGGAIYDTSGNTIVLTAYGVVWATHTNPTKADHYTNSGNGSGTGFTWTSSLTGLTPNTKYAVKGYFDYSGGTVTSGVEVSGTTLVALPTVTTTVLSPITATGATGGGNVTNAGGGTITARGVVWNTTGTPTTANTGKTIQTGTTGSFSSSLTGLIRGTLYYVRAYATNSAGTAYGTQLSFTTLTIPTVTTTTISLIGQTAATNVAKKL